jgi:hypothetical protein
MLAETHVFFLFLIRSRKSKDRQYNGQKKKDKWTMIYITLHRNIKIEQHEPHSKPDVNSGPPRKVKQFPLHMMQPSCYFLLQTRWWVMNVKNSSNVIKTTLQPSQYSLISWRLVNAIVIMWPLLDTTWVWNVDFGLVLEWWRCEKTPNMDRFRINSFEQKNAALVFSVQYAQWAIHHWY